MTRWIAAAFVAAVAAFFVLRAPSAGVGATAKDFTLYNDHSRSVTLSNLRGKVVVLDFWASWCGPCRMAMPAMQRLHESFAKRGAVVMGVNINDDKDPIQFMAEQGHTYPTLLGGDEVASQYEVQGIPTLLIIDPAGKIVFRQSGWAPQLEAQMASIIDAQLDKLGK